jgi:hypothetical protein
MQKTWKWAFLAAATAGAAFFAAEPLLAVTAVVQPHSSVAAQASDNLIEQVRRGGGRMGGFGGRSFRGGSFRRGGSMYWRRGSIGRRGWAGGRRWAGGVWHGGRWNRGNWRWRGRGWGYRRAWGSGFYGGYWGGYWGRRCPIGYRWTYNWGCVPLYGY